MSITPSSASVTSGQALTLTCDQSFAHYYWFRTELDDSIVYEVWELEDASGATITTYPRRTIDKYSSKMYAQYGATKGKSIRNIQPGSAVTMYADASLCSYYEYYCNDVPDVGFRRGGSSYVTITGSIGSGEAIRYRWQTYQGGQWTDIQGASSQTYTWRTSTADAGKRFTFRCLIENDYSDWIIDGASGGIELYVADTAISITTQPKSQTAQESENVTFTVKATGSNLRYQWYHASDETGEDAEAISGANTDTLTLTADELTNDGWYIYCVVSNSSYTKNSNMALLTVEVPQPPIITTQPQDQTVQEGEIATFTVEAESAEGEDLTFQWKTVDGDTQEDIAGATADTYTFTASLELDGSKYVCAVSNANGTTTSDEATLTVTPAPQPPRITGQPASSQTVDYGASISLFISAEGDNITYQWQKYTDGEWRDTVQGQNYTIAGTSENNGTQYQCVVSNDGGSVTSNVITLTVKPKPQPPKITAHPASQTVTEGDTVTLSVSAEGPNLSYQWKKYESGEWQDISGAKTNIYTFTATTDLNGSRYYCSVQNTDGIQASLQATLTVTPLPKPPKIVAQPASQTVADGETATFNVVADGPNLTYQWQKLINGTWQDISGANTEVYSITAEISLHGSQYKCIVTNTDGEAESQAASLAVYQVLNPPRITAQPSSQTAVDGTTVTFSVVADGSNLSYQWQKYSNGFWKNISGATADTYSFTATTGLNGAQYKCYIKNNADGSSATSEAATLTVVPIPQPQPQPPRITSDPASQTVMEGETAAFVVVAESEEGEMLAYQWQKLESGSWTFISGANRDIYSITATISLNGTQYRCLVGNDNGVTASQSATLTVIQPEPQPAPQPPRITGQPASQTVMEGEIASFTVTAEGEEGETLAYQWQKLESGSWTFISGANTSRYSITAESSLDGAQYRCLVANANGVTTSEAATLTVVPIPQPPKIIAQPASQTVTEGETATFSIIADGLNLAYQWVDGDTWEEIQGATADTYSVTATSVLNGSKYRCIVSNDDGEAYSYSATLIVLPILQPPKITAQPVSQTVTDGKTVSFTVAADGPNLSYQWAKDLGKTLDYISGATEETYSFTAALSLDGTKYVCIVSNTDGSVRSATATLTVNAKTTPLRITAQPASQIVTEGDLVTFSIGAEGTGLTYKWMRRNAPGWSNGEIVTWAWDVVQNGPSPAYSFAATSERNGAVYQCIVSDYTGNYRESDQVTLTVTPAPKPPEITYQPESQTVPDGAIATFNISATGDNLTYQWYHATDAEWTDSEAISGATGATLSFAADYETHNGWYIYCVVSNDYSAAFSYTVTLTVTPPTNPPTITKHPTDKTVTEGESVTFSIAATGSGDLSYQWKKIESGQIQNIPGATGTTLTVTATLSLDRTQYKCAVTNNSGTTVSNAATLRVNPKPQPPTITAEPASLTVTDGDTATFNVVADGPNLSYQWQKLSSSDTWKNISGAETDTYSITATSALNGSKYRCVVSNTDGTVKSKAATLSVTTPEPEPEPQPPIITADPASQIVTDGTAVTFSVSAVSTSSATLSYQWQAFANGFWQDISGETTSRYTLTATSSLNGTQYHCIVTDENGTTTSNPATLTVTAAPSPEPPGPGPGPEPEPEGLRVTVTPSIVYTGQRILIQVDGIDTASNHSFDFAIFGENNRHVYGYSPDALIINQYIGSVSVQCDRAWLENPEGENMTVWVYVLTPNGTQINSTFQIFRLRLGEHVIPFEIDDDVAALPVSGWLPHDTKRNNLYRLMLACGVNIVKNADGNPRFTFIRKNEQATEIDNDKIFLAGNVEYDRPYSSVTVAEHTYTPVFTANAVTLFDNTNEQEPLTEETEIWFNQAPIIVSTLATEGNLTIVIASENSAFVKGQGKLTGIPYTHTTKAVTRKNAEGDKEKTVSVQNDTMVSVLNSQNLLDRLYAFYCPDGQVKKISNEIVYTDESCGKTYSFTNPFDEKEKALLARINSKASTFNRASCEYYAGYNPPGPEGIFTHCIILDKKTFEEDGGEFIVPDDVTRMKVVIVGGGTGGFSGWPGENGGDSYAHTGIAEGEDISGIWYGAEGGDGGKGGDGGAPGRVFSVLIENPAMSYQYNIGDGGEGGAATGFIPDTLSELRTALTNENPDTEYTDEQIQAMIAQEAALTNWNGAPNPGSAGTASTFGIYSSADNGSYVPEAGVYDPIHGNYYALTGKKGISGGKGGARQAGNEDGFAWVTDGEDVEAPDGTVYHGGRTGRPMTSVDELPECNIIIYGGNGAGAAIGLDREGHEHMDGDESHDAWWEVTVDDGL